jgi:hypothetical protein
VPFPVIGARTLREFDVISISARTRNRRVKGLWRLHHLYDFAVCVCGLWIVSVLNLLRIFVVWCFVFPSLGFWDWVIFWSLDFFSGSRLTVGVGGDYIRPTTTAAPGFGRRL